jgi:peptidoglycan hydrolase CwlO-like protein
MNEINAMTTDEIIAKTREFEAEIRKAKTSMTRFQKEVKDLDLRIKENKEKLNMSTIASHGCKCW